MRVEDHREVEHYVQVVFAVFALKSYPDLHPTDRFKGPTKILAPPKSNSRSE